MNVRTLAVSLLLVGSGFCALVYQTVWIRELRLVFGASTASTAAVLGVFMAGLGLGSHILGKRADRKSEPLRFYGHLESGIALLAAISPLLIAMVSSIYFSTGGRPALGAFGATLLRLALGAAVLGVPTFLMGGTLPAVARAIESNDDIGRRRLALLYGANTLGAVAGVLLSTFCMLEHLGNRMTLWSAAVLNIIVALGAYTINALWMAKRNAPGGEAEAEATPEGLPAANEILLPADRNLRRFVLVSAAIVGFVFLLMELVWYRMLGPVLGGTTFTFGLILAFALLGIGIGGLTYSLANRAHSATLFGFAATCGLEALFLGIPFALGDRLAIFALLTRSLGAFGFNGLLLSWSIVTGVVVLLPSIIAGYQFPLLISLLGKGRVAVGRDVGRTYAWNTAGAIIGSIAGGFGLLPALTAPGTWRLSVACLVGLSSWAALSAVRRERRTQVLAWIVGLGALAVGTIVVTGPTAAWRHSPIGAGRARIEPFDTNGIKHWVAQRRRNVEWEKDGVESSVALEADDGYAFSINGKVDGHVRSDAPTQVMSGLVGALLHPNPKRIMVVGLGSGSTAGWLGAVPSVERVEVSELEPSILKIAEACTPVNHGVLQNEKVHIEIGDGREHLLASRERYDVIASEPSNPYRAGVASLFTVDFYRAVVRRLTDRGIFVQWVQAYEVDAATIRTVYASLTRVFPHVESWETQNGDLMLIASLDVISYDADLLRARLRQEPYRSAAMNVWRVDELEGFLAHYIAGPETARAIASRTTPNTDDRTVVEFGFARALGKSSIFDTAEVSRLAIRLRDDLPEIASGSIDRDRVAVERMSMVSLFGDTPVIHPSYSQQQLVRLNMHASFANNAYQNVLVGWRITAAEPAGLGEKLVLAVSFADQGDEAARQLLEQIRPVQPIEADVIEARLLFRQKRFAEAAVVMERALLAYRTNPWPMQQVMGPALDLALSIGEWDPDRKSAERLFRALESEFSSALYRQKRLATLYRLSLLFDSSCSQPRSLAAVHAFEPHLLWNRDFLTRRLTCHTRAGNEAMTEQARRDLATYDESRSVSLTEMMEK